MKNEDIVYFFVFCFKSKSTYGEKPDPGLPPPQRKTQRKKAKSTHKFSLTQAFTGFLPGSNLWPRPPFLKTRAFVSSSAQNGNVSHVKLAQVARTKREGERMARTKQEGGRFLSPNDAEDEWQGDTSAAGRFPFQIQRSFDLDRWL